MIRKIGPIWCAVSVIRKIGPIWCAVSVIRKIGPIFFSDTINSNAPMDRFQHHCFSFNLNDEETEYGFFLRDGATILTTNNSAAVALCKNFGN
jgi:hypothetical protein